jgi:hypothetical protein
VEWAPSGVGFASARPAAEKMGMATVENVCRQPWL